MSRPQQWLPEPVQQTRPLIVSTPGATEDEDMEEPVSSRTRTRPPKDKKAQRGFKRYQAAWEEAVHRRQDPAYPTARAHSSTPLEGSMTRRLGSTVASPHQGFQRSMQEPTTIRPSNLAYDFGRDDQTRYHADAMSATRPVSDTDFGYSHVTIRRTNHCRSLTTHTLGQLPDHQRREMRKS